MPAPGAILQAPGDRLGHGPWAARPATHRLPPKRIARLVETVTALLVAVPVFAGDAINQQASDKLGVFTVAAASPGPLENGTTIPTTDDAFRPAWGEVLNDVAIDADADFGPPLAPLLEPLLGSPLGEADAEALRIALTRALIEAGYVNSGYVFVAPIFRGGVLYLRREAGRITEVRLRGQNRLRKAYIEQRLAPAGETFNTVLLGERFRRLLSDPLFSRIDARIIPGTQAGQAVLDVDVERARAWEFALETHNQRPRSIGEYAAVARAGMRNLTGLGDALELSIQTPLGDGEGERYGFGWQLPLGTKGLALRLAADSGSATLVEQSLVDLNIESRIRSLEAGLSYPLIDDGQQRLALAASLLTRHNRTQLLGQDFAFQPGEPDSGTRVHDLRLQAEYARRDPHGLLILRATLTAGRSNVREVPFAEVAIPNSRHRALLLQGQYSRQLGNGPLRGVLRGTLQITPDRLVALERIAVGGYATVRGFLENTLVRDEARVINVELEVPLRRSGDLQITAIPFVDVGNAGNRGEPSVTLASAGLAGRLQWGGARLDVAWGHTLREPPAYRGGSGLQGNGVHFNLGYRF